jgi:Uma2 family endonuclease
MAMLLSLHRFTLDQYHRMGEAGIFHEDDRVELIHGQVVPLTPIGPDHASCVNRLTALFAPLAGRDATLSVQNPVILAEYEEPQPDFVVLRYRADGYRVAIPRPADVLLMVEVGDSSASRDRRTKIALYAEAGIPEAWLVDVPHDRVEVYRNPTGGRYLDVTTVSRGMSLTPLAFPGLTLSVDEILG